MKKHHLLALILLIALYLRAYEAVDRFEFAFDGDLYSWIVKDIVADKHLRLIGQMTTAHGIFIGPAFYYMLIPFFLLTGMDPVGALIPITLIGVAGTASYYFVFSRLFGQKAGLLASFLYAVLLSPVYFDRRVVPSTPTNLWLVWYFYSVVMLVRGNFAVLPLVGLLAGSIWHIHIALAPALAVVPAAIFLAKKLPTRKQLVGALVGFTIPSLPLMLFELRHGFSQTKSLIASFAIDHGGGTGAAKFDAVTRMLTENVHRLFFFPQTLPFNHKLFAGLLLLSAVLLARKKLLGKREVILFYFWVAVIILFFTVSSTPISEYYFANLEIIFLAIAVLLLSFLYKASKAGKYATIGLLLLVLLKNTAHFVKTDTFGIGYEDRKGAADFIAEDSREKNFPCVAVSYITLPGEDSGFRYFFWLNNLHLTTPQQGSPVYTIVVPDDEAEGPEEVQFGHVGVIPPEKVPTEEEMAEACSGENVNLTEPMFGFTN